MAEVLLRAGWCLMGVGSLLVCWQLSGMKTRQEVQSQQLAELREAQRRMLQGLVCEPDACTREALRRAKGAPADATVPLSVVR